MQIKATNGVSLHLYQKPKGFFFNVPDAVKVEHLFYFFNVTMPDDSKDVEQQELLFITGGNATEKQFSSFTL